MKNPLLDIEFLNQLHNHRQREVFARITLLNQNEMPIEHIEGRVTSGSVSVDGNSALRRTCNLTMILKNQNEINQFYWTFKSKFKLEVGLKNMINTEDYPDIIWFPQGIFILTTCNMNQTTNNYTITINGKDKMCKLNGDLGGNINVETDFGTLEEIDSEGNITYTKLLLKDIIREILLNQGGELAENIIINDLDDAGLELMEYRYEKPLYLFRKVSDETVNQITLNGARKVKKIGSGDTPSLEELNSYATVSDLLLNTEGVEKVYLKDQNDQWNTSEEYQVMRYQYGDLAGYRLTDLTYAGELKANIGETIVSVLDKIRNMLGHFEYFYNLDGKFVFQKKKTYISTPWGASEDSENVKELDLITDTSAIINLRDAKLITSFANNPNLLNVKNDFSVWGTYKSISGADIPIHMRYAIDKKPTVYKSIRDDKIYSAADFDWRELIYQMALDYYKCRTNEDFYFQMMEKNPWTAPTGRTGYEQYYTDIQGFWRTLYDPNPVPTYEEIEANQISTEQEQQKQVYIDQPYILLSDSQILKLKEELDKWCNDNKTKLSYLPSELYIVHAITANGIQNSKNVIYPFVKSPYCCLEHGKKYFYFQGDKLQENYSEAILNTMPLEVLYQNIDQSSSRRLVIYQKLIEAIKNEIPLYIKDYNRKNINEIDDVIKSVYQPDGKTWIQTIYRWDISDNYGTLSSTREIAEKITYIVENPNGEYNSENSTNPFWNKIVFESPDKLLFWFDFLDAEGSDLFDKYSVQAIGDRTKAINDTNVKSIYYRDVPNIVFQKNIADTKYDRQTGYTYIQIPDFYQSLFNISGRGKSAKERIDELVQDHSYCIEATSITTVPLYHLEPNTKILVKDDISKVDGEYIINKVTIPLAYNGTMNLTANKIVSNIR